MAWDGASEGGRTLDLLITNALQPISRVANQTSLDIIVTFIYIGYMMDILIHHNRKSPEKIEKGSYRVARPDKLIHSAPCMSDFMVLTRAG